MEFGWIVFGDGALDSKMKAIMARSGRAMIKPSPYEIEISTDLGFHVQLTS
jgi:hypothetical protein